MFRFQLGDSVKERITGYAGIIVVRSQYLTGCNRYGVQSRELLGGKPAEWQYFDEDLIAIDGENINVTIKQSGGPPRMEAPQR